MAQSNGAKVKRSITMKERFAIRDIVMRDAVNSVITVKTITQYTSEVAHAIGRDATELNPSTVQEIATALDIVIRTEAGNQSLPALVSRIIALEQQLTQKAEIIAEHELRIVELERAFIMSGPGTVGVGSVQSR